jgi:hypothetical protein
VLNSALNIVIPINVMTVKISPEITLSIFNYISRDGINTILHSYPYTTVYE